MACMMTARRRAGATRAFRNPSRFAILSAQFFGAKLCLVRVRIELLEREWTAEQFTDAVMSRQAMCNTITRFMTNYDLLLTPTISSPPFPIEQFHPERVAGFPAAEANPSPFMYPFNRTGEPAASVPAGFTAGGLPVELQIIGRHLADATELSPAAAFERLRPWVHLWPAIAGNSRPNFLAR